MTKGNMTREQAVNEAGLDAVLRVEAVNCDFSGRVQTDGDTRVEFTASTKLADDRRLIAYYYQEQDDLGVESLDCLDWRIAAFEIV